MSDGGMKLGIEAVVETEINYTEKEIEDLLEKTELSSREEIIEKSKEKFRSGLVHHIDSSELKSVELSAEVAEDE